MTGTGVNPAGVQPIQRVSHSTLTAQTVQAIQDAIKLGKFAAGTQLPSEPELLQMLGVSRTTLREALRILEEQRFITKRRGVGTFVMVRTIVKDMSLNFGITEMISQAGLTPGTSHFDIRLQAPAPRAAREFSLSADDLTVVIDRVRTANQTPVVFTQDIMPQAILGGWMPTIQELNQRSLYECLERFTDIRIFSGMASFSPVKANADIAGKLGVRRNALLLQIEQVDFDADQRAVLLSTEYHLTDKFNFIVHRKGPHR